MLSALPGTHSLDEITEEAAVILNLVPNLSGLVGVEVGTLRGKTASILLLRRSGLQLVCVDPFWTEGIVEDSPEEVEEAWHRNTAAFGTRRSLIRRPSVESAKRLADLDQFSQLDYPPVDFVYIDAMHDYDNVAADIRAWWPHVRRGGLLMGHDYGRERPEHVQPGTPGWGVARAVHEWLLEVDLPLHHLERTTWAVKKP